MSRTVRISLIVILSAILIYSLVRIVMIQLEYKEADDIYQESRAERFHVSENTGTPEPSDSESAAEPEPETYFPEADADVEGLLSINPDIVGWIWIPDTTISYPLLQAADNWKYLNLSYNFKQTNSGSIFMDFRNAGDLSDDNTVIFGHNMKSGGMFGSLKDFSDIGYIEDHPHIYIFTADRVLKYRIFAAYKTESTSDSYTLDFSGDIGYDDFIAYVAAEAGDNMTEAPAAQTPLITLSTCTSGRRTERFVVHAAFVAEKSLTEASPAA